MAEGRREVRAMAYFPGLSAEPWHDYRDLPWLVALHAHANVIREELEASLASSHWAGNDCAMFDKHGWGEINLNSYGVNHPNASILFPRTLELLNRSGVPYGPREVSIVRQAANSGLPRHSDQRNYMLTAHVPLKGANCMLECDGEERMWDETGIPTVIDTTFGHSTWNGSSDPCYILLVDFWHPDLTSEEVAAMRTFMGLEGEYLEDSSFVNMHFPGLRAHGTAT
eukprot:gnl/TRDRNA2_/TRDRNA2_92802_c0_seq2.p1 gnl/TRDRNA2_/TRDRNA2_92802_c0~~gnl/TRDRNA2_/TRDRNA2_92802_c0_seq2.p1  ORF type:complete len:234 (+),score=18.98 gnl/TRDRNA2_/TRDRNA2_92802_c0_seq2:27-704(+)